MIPGTQSKLSDSVVASAETITVGTDIVRVTGTTSIATINQSMGNGFGGWVVLVPVDGNTALLTTGNISLAVTMLVGRATLLVYSAATEDWYPGAVS